MKKKQQPITSRPHGVSGRGGTGWGDPPPPSLVWAHGASRERINRYKRNRTAGGVISKMEVAQEELLETFEEFELDLEVEEILKKVKRELTVEDQTFREFAETLKELEPEKAEAQRRREAQAARFHQLCYPQHTCEWFVEGLDYCCNYWRYHFKRPDTPPAAPPPSPDVGRKRIAPPQSPLQESRKRCRTQRDPKSPAGKN